MWQRGGMDTDPRIHKYAVLFYLQKTQAGCKPLFSVLFSLICLCIFTRHEERHCVCESLSSISTSYTVRIPPKNPSSYLDTSCIYLCTLAFTRVSSACLACQSKLLLMLFNSEKLNYCLVIISYTNIFK